MHFILRRRWWILLPACIVSLGAISYVMRLPNRYESEALLVIAQQQVSQRLVEPDASEVDPITAAERLILSRNRLMGVIDEFGLYPKERQRMSADELAEIMRERDLVIERQDPVPGRVNEFRAFAIHFSAGNPQLAQAVTSRLTSLFIEQNFRDRGDRATRTASFLNERLEAAKRKLNEQEQRLQDFKTRNSGELSEQQQLNVAALTSLRLELQSTAAALSRLQQQRAALEATLAGNISALQNQRNVLLTKFTPKHAEVIKKDREIAKAQMLLDHFRNGTPPDASDGSGPADPVEAQFRNQAEAIAAEIAGLTRDEQRLRGEIASYQGRLSLTPVRDQQLAALTRDYEFAKKDYADLLEKQQRTQLATNLEERQEGEQFRLVDPPTLPTNPVGPKRFKMSLTGMAGGAAFGIVLAVLMELRKRSFYEEKELGAAFAVPLIVGIPVLMTLREQRKRRWRLAVEWVMASLLAGCVIAAEFYVYVSARGV
jgi:succinoglycan biosynthesis transport protein ExoP